MNPETVTLDSLDPKSTPHPMLGELQVMMAGSGAADMAAQQQKLPAADDDDDEDAGLWLIRFC